MARLFTRRALLARGVGWGLAGLAGGALVAATPTAPPELPALFPPPTMPVTAAAGDGARYPPIIFLHGNGNSSALWLATCWRFESHGWPRDRLVALDLPYPTARDDDGVAQPGRSGSAEQRRQLTGAIGAVLARTGARRVALIGSSRGGNAIRGALKWGGAAPAVGHAILCGTPSHGAYRRAGDNNEFNGDGAVLRGLNAGAEVVPGVAYLTIRSDRNDLFAQPGGGGYDGPALAGATNVVIPGIDHDETATSPAAFAAMLRFLTGSAAGGEAMGQVAPEGTIVLDGRVTGHAYGAPTNLPVSGVAVAVYALDPATGARLGPPRHERVTGADGAWGPLVSAPGTPHEFVISAPGRPPRQVFRAPFPRSSPYVGFRLGEEEPPRADVGLVVFSRPRGYLAGGRDAHLLDGQPVPGVPDGVPREGRFVVPIAGPARAIRAELNGEVIVARVAPGMVAEVDFHY